MGGRGVTAHH
uniref:Uncharacterized protein n=1 Tax=Arundo donax TaxID=35708 RepID=A0A0A8YK60_ARUDO